MQQLQSERMRREVRAEAARPSLAASDQRIVIYNVSWKTYVVMRELLDSPGLRMTYDRGTLELMSPSPKHELIKTNLARFVEFFALEYDVPLNGYGSTTFKRELKERGLEPDECYVIGGNIISDEHGGTEKGRWVHAPDIAIEVVVSSGGIAKLAIYQTIGVREVWFYEDGGFQIHRLGSAGYEPIATSELIPDLDFEVLARFALREDQHQAVKDYRDGLRARQLAQRPAT